MCINVLHKNRSLILIISFLLQSCANKPVEITPHASGDQGKADRSYKRSQRKENVKVFEQFDYYKVTPASKKDLHSALLKASPIKEQGDGYVGQTQANIKYTIDYLTDSQMCWVDDVRVEYHVIFVMPTLISDNKEVQRIWNAWYPNLLKHEHTHRDIGLGIANEINQKLNDLPPQKSCEALLESGRKIVAELEAKEDVLQTKFDQDTNHGQTEGLIFSIGQ